jgi:hypothetical protein
MGNIPYQPITPVLQTGNGQNLLSWPIVSGASSYAVQRSTDGINYSLIGSPATNYFVDMTVSVGVNYFYQVASVNTNGTSPLTPSYPANITPCLPGQINLGYLRYMSQLKADKLNSEYLTTDEWNFNINQSATNLYDILCTNYGDDYFMAPYLLIPLTGQDFYPLPDGSNYPDVNMIPAPAIYKLLGIDANISGASNSPNAGWVPLSRFNWSDRDKYTTFPGQAGALNNIYQMAYRQMGNNLFILPANLNQLLRLSYVPRLAQMLLDTDMLPFSISGWSEFVIIDAAMKAMIKEKTLDKWNALSSEKQIQLDRINTAAANRDAGQPNTVSNVRNTMGDPGFSNYGFGGFGGWSGTY